MNSVMKNSIKKHGLILYKAEDAKKNRSFIDWLINAGKKLNMRISFLSYEDWVRNGMHQGVDFVINRTREVNVAVMLELCEIPVYNNSEITMLGNNKLLGYQYAKAQSFSILPIGIQGQLADKTYVIKPFDGHGGEGVSIYSESMYVKASEEYNAENRARYFFQEMGTNIVGDMRCYVIGNEICHTVLRHRTKDTLLCNFSKGAEVSYFKLPNTILKTIQAFIAPLDIDYAGVDFLIDDSGNYFFNEFEDVVGSRMLSHLGKNDTVEKFLTHISNKC